MAKLSLPLLLISSSLLSSSFAVQPDSGLNECFLSDQAYSGTAIMNLTTGCSRECQRKCEGNEDCLFWTYSADAVGFHDCILFSSGVPEAAAGKISGPKRCSEPFHCLLRKLEAGGIPLKVLDSESVGECSRHCKLLSSCSYANWTSDKKCHLKDSSAMQAIKFGISDCTATPRDCSPGWCYSHGKFLQCSGSNRIETVNDIPNARKCQETCRLHDGCDFWSWNLNGNKQCVLMKEDCFRRANVVTDNNAFMGPKRCGNGNYCHVASNYSGGDIDNFITETVEICNDKCFEDHRCQYFTYRKSTKRCWLKNSESLRGRMADNDHISGPAICLGKPPCYEDDVDYSGGGLRTVNNVPSEYQCVKHCRNTVGCNLITHVDSTGACHLKKGSANSSRLFSKGVVAVPLECHFNRNY